MLISPAEPKIFHSYGKTSSVPERYGADFWWPHKTLTCIGVQRKTILDLLASMADGRLAKELGQMKRLGLAVVMIEGEPRWTTDGLMVLQRQSVTRAQWRGMMFSLQSHGCWVVQSLDQTDSIELLLQLREYLNHTKLSSLTTRPKASSGWGKATNKDWGVHLLQGFDGIGQGVATAIYDHFQGVPLRWTVEEKELEKVKGVGKGRAKKMMEALNGEER